WITNAMESFLLCHRPCRRFGPGLPTHFVLALFASLPIVLFQSNTFGQEQQQKANSSADNNGGAAAATPLRPSSSPEVEIEKLKAIVASQEKRIDQLEELVNEQKKIIEQLIPSSTLNERMTGSTNVKSAEVANNSPAPGAAVEPLRKTQDDQPSPLTLKIGK